MTVDFNKPILTDSYSEVLTYIRDNIISSLTLDYTSALNIPAGAVRYNTSDDVFEKYDSSLSSWDAIGSFRRENTWSGINHYTNTIYTNNIISNSTTEQYNIGTSTNPYGITYSHQIIAPLSGLRLVSSAGNVGLYPQGSGALECSTSELYPHVDYAMSLGNANHEWIKTYTRDIAANGNLGLYAATNSAVNFYLPTLTYTATTSAFRPTGTNGAQTLGDSTHPWGDINTKGSIIAGSTFALTVNNVSLYSTGGTLRPTAARGIHLGSAAYPFNILYASGIYSRQGYSGTGASTPAAPSTCFNFFWDANNKPHLYVNNGDLGIITLSTSDKRLKENIEDMESGLDVLNKLEPKTFNFIGNEHREAGFIAQQVDEVFDEATYLPAYESGFYGINPVSLIALCVKSIQELSGKIEEIKTNLSKIL